MINATATILRVRESFGLDTVLVEEVGGFGRPDSYFSLTGRMLKSSAMAMGGVDSFWRVSGERTEKPPLLKQEKPYRPGSKSQSYSAYGPKSAQPITNQQSSSPATETLSAPPPEQVSYRSEVRLEVGYSHPSSDHGQTLAMLTGSGLRLPSRQRLIAVEVASGLWLRESQLYHVDGMLFAPGQKKHAVTGYKLLQEPQTIQAGGGVVVFLEPLQWSEATLDCRSEDEVSADVVSWLQRLSVFDGQTHSSDEVRGAVETLQSAVAGSVTEEEFASLAIAIRAAEAKPQLGRLLPELLRNDPFWREQVQTTIEKAVESKRGEIDAAFADEIAEKESRLDALQRDVADAERRLTAAEERERAYRAGAEDVRKLVEEQVSVVTRDVFEPALRSRLEGVALSVELHADVERLAARLAHMEQVSAEAAEQPETVQPLSRPLAAEVVVCDSKDQRSLLFQELQERTAVRPSELAFVLARMFGGGFPVLAGETADTVAVEIAAMLGGSSANVIFCDPTKVTFSDLFEGGQPQGSLSAVIELAKASPSTFVPLVFCGLTRSPCEFWLPAVLDGRRTGAIPTNIAMLGTVAPDGIRVEMPKSVLRRVEPVEVVGSSEFAAMSKFEGLGLWPIPAPSLVTEQRTTAVDMLISFEADGRPFAEAVKSLSVVLCETECDAAEVAQSFIQGRDWAKSLSATSPDVHPLLRYFTNFEG